MADRHKKSRDGKHRGLARDGVGERGGFEGLPAGKLGDCLVPVNFDLGVGRDAVGQHLRRTELVAAVDQVDLRAETREEKRLRQRRVAASDDGYLLVFEEETVACCAVRHALA